MAQALNLPPHFAVGLILVGCCPGGTASNLVTYIAGADVALSVVMTVCSTMAAIILTPLLTQLLVGSMVPVDTWLLFKQTLQVVIIPVMLGVLLNRSAPNLVARMIPVAPLLSVAGVCFICAVVFAANAEAILIYGSELILAAALLHGGGFLIGHYFAQMLGYEGQSARTISIEVGNAKLRSCHRARETGISVAAACACRGRGFSGHAFVAWAACSRSYGALERRDCRR